eukprot:GHVP01044414.1.p1 GENE.GHVP01044414.1~~GHVP01044414.1.p1  ORF type:complete len:140 (-),score=5.20 GHVP01044414.1:702-1121(-)
MFAAAWHSRVGSAFLIGATHQELQQHRRKKATITNQVCSWSFLNVELCDSSSSSSVLPNLLAFVLQRFFFGTRTGRSSTLTEYFLRKATTNKCVCVMKFSVFNVAILLFVVKLPCFLLSVVQVTRPRTIHLALLNGAKS